MYDIKKSKTNSSKHLKCSLYVDLQLLSSVLLDNFCTDFIKLAKSSVSGLS